MVTEQLARQTREKFVCSKVWDNHVCAEPFKFQCFVSTFSKCERVSVDYRTTVTELRRGNVEVFDDTYLGRISDYLLPAR